MADYTENYNLIKPSDEDFYNVSDFNQNAEIVDQSLKILSDALKSTASEETLSLVLEKANSLITSVGGTSNTGGTASAGSVFAKLNKVLTDYTSQRAGKLDKLDTTVSSRAPSSTALSNATWTNTRAGYLDYLANGTYGLSAIRTFLTTVKTTASQSGIKSVQRGTATFVSGSPTTVTISSVNMSKAFVIANVSSTRTDFRSCDAGAGGYLSSSTKLVLSCNYGGTRYIPWQVVEFY